jgi:hypothetical protein
VGYQCDIDIGIRKRFEFDDQENTGRLKTSEIDPLVLLVEQMHELFCGEHRVLADDIHWRQTDIRATYIAEHLRLHRQFTGIIRIRFDAHKDLDFGDA